MPDTIRSRAALLSLFADNASGDISAQDQRDFTVSAYSPQTVLPGGRLTLTSGTPVTTSDVTGATRIYYTPYLHNGCGLYDGTSWTLFALPEYAIDLGTLTSGLPYDVFTFFTTAAPSSTNTGTDIVTFGSAQGWATGSVVFVDATASGLTAGTAYFWNAASSTTGSFHTTLANALAGTSKVDLTGNVTANVTGVSMEFTAWTNDTTRATALTTQDGVYVKTGATTRRYLGTFRTTSTTTTEDSYGGASQAGGKRFLWNLYNQVPRTLGVKDTTDSWTYATATWRQANNATGNKVEYVCGLNLTPVRAVAYGCAEIGGSSAGCSGVGIDATNANSALIFVENAINTGAGRSVIPASYVGYPGLGYHYVAWLEYTRSGTVQYDGDLGVASIQTGLIAEVMA